MKKIQQYIPTLYRQMNPKNFILITSLSVSLISCTNNHQKSSEVKPNIIFIMSDDHASQAISCYGSKLNETPNIDKLAHQGLLFKNAFVTNSICAPSRAVILTGKHSHLNGVRDNHIHFDSSQVTFPKILKENGYETAIVGKWHLKSQPTGFDYWNVLPGQGDYYNPKFIKMGRDTVYEGYVTEITTELALDWLRSGKSDQPFMLMVHHKAPHRNWMPHTKNLDKYEDEEFLQPVSFKDDYSGREHLKNQKLTVAHHMDIMYDYKIPCDTCDGDVVNHWVRDEYNNELSKFTPEQRDAWEVGYKNEVEEFFSSNFTSQERINWNLKRYLQDYLRCILSVDESVGEIMQYIEQNGLSENTLIVYTSDQGFFLGEHGLFDKRYMYEESLRTPLIMKYPAKITKGIRSNELVQNLDLAPTILDVAGIAIPEPFQGKSLTPLFITPDLANWRESIYYQFYESGWGVPEHYGIRTKNFKLIHFTTKPDSWELYDLKADPYEMKNLYSDVTYVLAIKKLKKELIELQTKYKIPPE